MKVNSTVRLRGRSLRSRNALRKKGTTFQVMSIARCEEVFPKSKALLLCHTGESNGMFWVAETGDKDFEVEAVCVPKKGDMVRLESLTPGGAAALKATSDVWTVVKVHKKVLGKDRKLFQLQSEDCCCNISVYQEGDRAFRIAEVLR